MVKHKTVWKTIKLQNDYTIVVTIKVSNETVTGSFLITKMFPVLLISNKTSNHQLTLVS